MSSEAGPTILKRAVREMLGMVFGSDLLELSILKHFLLNQWLRELAVKKEATKVGRQKSKGSQELPENEPFLTKAIIEPSVNLFALLRTRSKKSGPT